MNLARAQIVAHLNQQPTQIAAHIRGCALVSPFLLQMLQCEITCVVRGKKGG